MNKDSSSTLTIEDIKMKTIKDTDRLGTAAAHNRALYRLTSTRYEFLVAMGLTQQEVGQ